MPNRHDLLFTALESFVNTLTERYDVADVLYALTDSAASVLGTAMAGVSLVDDHGELQYLSANSQVAAELEKVQQHSRQGPCHQAFMTGQMVAVADIATHLEWPIYLAKASEVGLGAVLGVPMASGDRCIGALNIYSLEAREWTDGDAAAAMLLARMATSYVLHASERDRVLRVNEQLQHALDSRVVVEQAKGLLAGEMGISLEASFELLRRHSRRNRATLRSVADAVVNLGLRPTPSSDPPTETDD